MINIKRIVLVGEYYKTENHHSHSGKQIKELVAENEDMEAYRPSEFVFTVEDNDIVCHMPDGTSFKASDPPEEKPRWVMDKSNSPRKTFMFEQMGVRCFPSSETVFISTDKALAQSLMCGTVPSLNGILYFNEDIKEDDVVSRTSHEYPYILKTVAGHGGTDVHKINSSDERDSIVKENEYKRCFLLSQQPADRGDDLRIYICKDEIVGSVLRRVTEGQWQANRAFEPEYIEYEFTQEEKDMILAGAAKFPEDRGMISLDMLFKDGQMYLCETNTNPSINALGEICDNSNFFRDYVKKLDEWTS